MVYTNYSDLVVAADSHGFGPKYVDLVMEYNDARVQSKYMPITEIYSRDEGRSSVQLSESAFMYSAKFLEGFRDGNSEQVLMKKMEEIKKKKQKQKGSGKRKIVSQGSADLANLPK